MEAMQPEGAALPAQGNIKSVTISAVVTRANGKREDLGVVSHWRAPKWKRVLWSAIRFLKGQQPK